MYSTVRVKYELNNTVLIRSLTEYSLLILLLTSRVLLLKYLVSLMTLYYDVCTYIHMYSYIRLLRVRLKILLQSFEYDYVILSTTSILVHTSTLSVYIRVRVLRLTLLYMSTYVCMYIQ